MGRAEYRPEIVFLSIVVTYVGSYLTVALCEQLRQVCIETVDSRHLPKHLYLGAMTLCLGIVGIWCMHIIGMFAVTMYDDYGNEIIFRYDIGLAVLSIVISIIFTLLGFYMSSLDLVFTKTKKQIVELFVEDAGSLSMKNVKHFTRAQMLWMMATHFPSKLLYGGFFTGSGAIMTHYVGMAAMHFPGEIVWDTGLIAASIALAWLIFTVACWILFRILSLYSNKESLRLLCALCMTCAMCGMHYVGMAAAHFEFDNSGDTSSTSGTISSTTAFIAAVIISGCVCFLVMVFSMADMRHSIHKLSTELQHADEAMMSLPVISVSSCAAAAQRYLVKRRASQVCMSVLNQPNACEHDLEAMAHAHEASEDSSRHITRRISRSISQSAFAQSISTAFHHGTHVISQVPFSSGLHSGNSSPARVQPSPVARYYRDLDGTMFIPAVLRRKPTCNTPPPESFEEHQLMLSPRSDDKPEPLTVHLFHSTCDPGSSSPEQKI
jgi:NO-binding membrane sensor protein with MHYT domain